MIELSGQGGHSAIVKMRLLVNGDTLRVAQMGPNFLLLDSPINHPPAEAIMVLRVDESETRWPVRLPDGISAGSKRVAIANP
jgi:hypothetical protein